MFRSAPCRHYHVQTSVIGAGVMGLSVARALAKKGHEVLLFERSSSIGSEISSRNSEVIHAGIYYDTDTMPLKSKLCVEGKRLLYDYLQDRAIPHLRCGKLLVATDAKQRDVGLPGLVEYARRNGVLDLKTVSDKDVSDSYSDVYEPNIRCCGGVYSPSTGIVDSHAFMTSLLADAEGNSATLALNCSVEGGRPISHGGRIELVVDATEIACENVLVCAGLSSDKIASSILSSNTTEGDNGEISEKYSQIPEQYYAKGSYFKLENQSAPFSRLIYPLPDPSGGLGVHATIDMAGSTRFGPDVEWIDNDIDSPDSIDLNVDPHRAEAFYSAVRKYWPDLQDENLVPDYSGIRPKLMHPNAMKVHGSVSNNRRDFMIAGPKHHGVQGLTVLLGIESPGLTASLAIGKHVAETIE